VCVTRTASLSKHESAGRGGRTVEQRSPSSSCQPMLPLAAYSLPLLRCVCHEASGAAPHLPAVPSRSCSYKRCRARYSISVTEVKGEPSQPPPWEAGLRQGDPPKQPCRAAERAVEGTTRTSLMPYLARSEIRHLHGHKRRACGSASRDRHSGVRHDARANQASPTDARCSSLTTVQCSSRTRRVVSQGLEGLRGRRGETPRPQLPLRLRALDLKTPWWSTGAGPRIVPRGRRLATWQDAATVCGSPDGIGAGASHRTSTVAGAECGRVAPAAARRHPTTTRHCGGLRARFGSPRCGRDRWPHNSRSDLLPAPTRDHGVGGGRVHPRPPRWSAGPTLRSLFLLWLFHCFQM
jgi:hypothetical protein